MSSFTAWAIGTGISVAISAACTALSGMYYACRGLGGFIGGALKYYLKKKYVQHRAWSWTALVGWGIVGMASSIALGRFLKIKGVASLILKGKTAAVSWLQRRGWGFVAAMVFNISTALLAWCSPTKKQT